jgi:GAF domain-containing protein
MSTADQMLTFARIAQQLQSEPATDLTLEKVITLARDTVPGCDMASISMRRGAGKVETPASTNHLAVVLDEYQYQFDEGPCLDAIWVQDEVVIEDMASETRWPNWAPRAAALGIGSILSVRLATADQVVGGLNLYSKHAQAYSDDAITTAHIYAVHASNAIAVTEQVTGLQTALQSRHTIGVAQGLMMHRYGLTEDAAFQVLRRLSSHHNRKLRDVASDVVKEFRDNGQLA